MNGNTDISPALVTQLLKQILATRSPELGARLKQRLLASLREQGLPSFNEKHWGHKSFQAFLEKTQGDWLQIEPRAQGSGDIWVTLRASSSVQPSTSTVTSPQAYFRNEVWQAFTNPDPSRQRYLHRSSGQLVHFKAGEGSAAEAAQAAASELYAPIDFIDGKQQYGWMVEFLNSVPVVGDERRAYDSMMGGPYSSAMNAAFTRALGDRQQQWTAFRTSRVATHIADWAATRAVPMSLLHRAPTPSTEVPGRQAAQTVTPSSTAEAAPRHEAAQLLGLLTDDEIRRVVLPVMLSMMLLRSRD